MWVVAKIKSNELNTFSENIKKKSRDQLSIYYPKMRFNKYKNKKYKEFSKKLLDNYVFCYCESFKNHKLLDSLQFIKGLDYFLTGSKSDQTEIIKFINFCKSYETDDGFLKSEFFSNIIEKKGKFMSGPFSNLMFNILEKKKNKIKILLGNLSTTVDLKNNLYCPV